MGFVITCAVLMIAAVSHVCPQIVPQDPEICSYFQSDVNVTCEVSPAKDKCECLPFVYCESASNQHESAEDKMCETQGEIWCCQPDTSPPSPSSPSSPSPSSPSLSPPPPPPSLPSAASSPPSTSLPPSQKKRCGVRHLPSIDERVTAPNHAEYGQLPWMIAVSQLNKANKTMSYLCGGSLIHPQVVLTATHCVRGKSDLIIRAGEWNTQADSEQYHIQVLAVSEVITHEHFQAGQHINNPALLVLKSPVDMGVPSVGLICLPQPDDTMDGRTCVASGWGKDQWGEMGSFQAVLKKIELPIVAHGPCQSALQQTRLGASFSLDQSFLCAGGVQGQDTCQGDGGSPLVCPRKEDPTQYEQAGIVSWGIDCGTKTPGVYVNVARFVNWIHNKLKAHAIVLD